MPWKRTTKKNGVSKLSPSLLDARDGPRAEHRSHRGQSASELGLAVKEMDEAKLLLHLGRRAADFEKKGMLSHDIIDSLF